MPANGEITEAVLDRFSALKPEIVRSVEFADVVKVDSSTLFQGLHRHFLVIIVDWFHVEEALSQRKTWLTKLIYECLLEPSAVVPIISCNRYKTSNHVASIRLNGSEGVKGQPIIDYADLEKTHLPAKEILRRAIVDSEACFKVNPYNVHVAAVRGMFFGRKEELHNIQSGQGHVFIVGARRIGKTSLVTRLVETINNQPKSRLEMGGLLIDNRAVQVDASRLGEDVSKIIWEAILYEFGITPQRWRTYSRKRSIKKHEHEPVQHPAFALQALIDNAKGKLTIVLDEMDGWIKREAGSTWQTLDRLRALTDGGRARLVLVGYELFRAALQNDRFPLYGRGTIILLGPIDRRTLTELVTKPLLDFGIDIHGEEIVTQIWKKTGGMPHVVQDVCNILLNDCLAEKNSVITTRHVSQAFRKSQKHDEFIRGVVNCPFPLAEAITGIIALNRKEGAVETRDIVRELVKFGYVFKEDEFDLALDYLTLRYTIDVADDFRTSWRMSNEGQGEYMYHHITGKGIDNWLSALIKKHNHGDWKRYYEEAVYT